MIARLTGTLIEAGADHVVIDVGGVGYLAHSSTRTIEALGALGGDVRLMTEMQVREDAITLFGFARAAERDWFRLLTGVQGVGGRVALNILSVLDPDALALAISAQDKAMVARANGVGAKLAERIVRELKDKAGALGNPLSAAAVRGAGGAGAGGSGASGPIPDALAALASLGFRPSEANTAVAAALDELGDAASLDALVRLALRKVGR